LGGCAVPEPVNLKVMLENLNDIVLDLVDERDKSAATEAALIQTLTELLPDFAKKFAQSYTAERTKTGLAARELLASLQAQMKKISP
jgi:hypothetical protein